MWDATVRSLLEEMNVSARERAIQGARQFRLDTGEIINTNHVGSVTFQGKDTSLAADLRTELTRRGATVINGCAPPRTSVAIVPRQLVGASDELAPDRDPASISVEVPFAEELSDPALEVFARSVGEFAEDLSRRVIEFERRERTDSQDPPEYTIRIVKDAAVALRRPRPAPQISTMDILYDLLFLLASLIGGAMANFLHSTWQSMAFATCLTVAIVILIVKAAATRRRMQ